MRVKASGADTLGQLNVMDFTYPPGLSVPTHVHDGEDEMFYLLEGELQGLSDDEEWSAVPGTFVPPCWTGASPRTACKWPAGPDDQRRRPDLCAHMMALA
jgi:hypothetical protein